MTGSLDPAEPCPDCATPECEALFHACLAADFSDERYGVVHHLVVAAYGLQHRWYTEPAAPRVIEFVLTHLERPPNDHDRRMVRAAATGAVRRAVTDRRGPKPEWSLTVAHVDRRGAETYTATVRAWARSVATEHRRAERDTQSVEER